jgi:protein CrcB
MAGPQGKKEDKIVRKTFLFRRQIITFVMILQTNMKALLLVGAGGFAGSALRYLISRLMLPWAVSSGFPFSTLTVNVAGSLLIGALMGLGLSGGWALLCIVGFCGGFTTFSTFSLETVTLLRAGSYLPAALYMWSSMVLSIAAVCGGYYLGTKFNTFE